MPASFNALAGRTVTALDAIWRPGAVPLSFWAGVALVVMLAVCGVRLDGYGVTIGALLLILIGGLPHGGYDLALAHRLFRLGGWHLGAFTLLYCAVAAAMLALWTLVPLAALAAFLLLSAVHFGDDWGELPDGLLRICAGAAVIVAPAIGQPQAVAALFVMLAGEDAIWLARLAMAAAPVVLLVSAGAIGIAWKLGHRHRALALVTALLLLLAAPPLIGFALFFALLHAPRHMATVRSRIDLRSGWAAWCGSALAAVSLLIWMAVGPALSVNDGVALGASAFQLLSVLAAPHLLCSHMVEARVARRERGQTRQTG